MKEISALVYSKIRSPFIFICTSAGLTSLKISLINHFITILFGCYFFSRGEYVFGLLGVGICFINGFLDYLDGDVARSNNARNPVAAWWDSGFDVIIQSIVMGAIAIGCHKNGLSLIWIIMFYIGNSANNWVSFNYNEKFGFDSDKGNSLFRMIMDRKCHIVNKFLRDIIDPTSNHLTLAIYTYRYWIVFGYILGVMPTFFKVITIIGNIKWVVMFLVYSVYLSGWDKLFVIKALSALDDEKEDFYCLRIQK
jgi:hypothetical protein